MERAATGEPATDCSWFIKMTVGPITHETLIIVGENGQKEEFLNLTYDVFCLVTSLWSKEIEAIP